MRQTIIAGCAVMCGFGAPAAHADDPASVNAFRTALLGCKLQVSLSGPLTGLEQRGFQSAAGGFRWSSGGDTVNAVTSSYTCTVTAQGPSFGPEAVDALLPTWAQDNRLVRDGQKNVWNGPTATMAGGFADGRIRVVFA